MYWTILGGSARIEKSSMSGENRTILHNTGLYSPTALAVDYERQLLYWVDLNYNRIESSGVDGSNRRTILTRSFYSYYGAGLAVIDNTLYYNPRRRRIETVFEANSVNQTNIQDHTLYLPVICSSYFDFSVVNARKQVQGKEAITVS